MGKENDLLEKTLSIAESGYAEAYRFLLDEYQSNARDCGPQTLYFLACLAGGAHRPEEALEWLRRAIAENGWWYRPEVLEDEDLGLLADNAEFVSLKSLSDNRYAEAASNAKAVFSWQRKNADNLFLAVHGNTQNGRIAREDWRPMFSKGDQWQLETIQSAVPDGYGTYRWNDDQASCLPVAEAIEEMQSKGYKKIACGGFSAGCDMLLRAILLAPVRCDVLVLQSPWIPVLEECKEDLMTAIKQKSIGLNIFCGSDDEDCLPMAKKFCEAANEKGIHAELKIQEGIRHQFPEKPLAIKDLL
ncbi:MAG: TPR end-of-group domain-containing protein [Candidatus Faecivicinus sp.]